jgi:hypothetical protein
MMRKAVRERLTFSNVVSVIALFVALGGTAVATLDRNSVGTLQLKRNAVTTGKIRSNAVTTGKIRRNAVTTGKIRNGAVTGPKIRLATVGKVPLAELADTAAPLAFARVAFPGTIDPAYAKRIAQTNLSHPTDGIYCFDLPYPVRTGQVSMEGDVEPDDLASIEVLGPNETATLSGCAGGADVEVRTFDTETGAGPQDGDFYIELNG